MSMSSKKLHRIYTGNLGQIVGDYWCSIHLFYPESDLCVLANITFVSKSCARSWSSPLLSGCSSGRPRVTQRFSFPKRMKSSF